MDIQKVLSELTAEEKAALVSGTDFMYTNPVPRLGIPQLRMSDGPHGLRAQEKGKGGDNGVTGSLPATAFPAAACTASGWNPENLRRMGAAIARECHKYGVHMLLGPGANIKRNPLGGRNFEYFSEDPLLAGKLAAAQVQGLQSGGVAACVKHFALNNSENYRFLGDSIADGRAMREIYLKVFERIVREGKPAAVMCAYNKVNGEYCSQNKFLLTDILRGEWGFGGLTMTDWGAMHDREKSLRAGMDLEMPGDTPFCRRRILDGLAEGSLSAADLDKAVENVLRAVEKYAKEFPDDADFEANDALACEIAQDCAVLLKNDGMLPLAEGEEIFVAGDLFETMRYQGAGSSMISPTRLTSPRAAFDALGVRYAFARGYAAGGSEPRQELIGEAVRGAEKFEKVLVFAGLTDSSESEGCDRPHMRLPDNQLALIGALLASGKRVAVVLFGGSPAELPFADKAGAILNMYLPGQAGGRACANLLFGRANPCGKLAETWSLAYQDVPFGSEFGEGVHEVYKESVFVGYRYYSTAGVPVRYPFGYGLSYTSFRICDMRAERAGDSVKVSCTVKNTGGRAGAEVVQLYVRAPQGDTFRPLRELRAFQKVYLAAGESARAELSFDISELRSFDMARNAWVLEGGEYELQICSDSQTVLLSETVRLEGECLSPYPADVLAVYRGADLAAASGELFEKMSGRKIPPLPPKKPVTVESRFSDLQETRVGKLLYKIVMSVPRRMRRKAEKLPAGTERENKIKGAQFLERILESNTLVSMSMAAGKMFPYNFAAGAAHLANGCIFKALRCFCAKIKVPRLPKDGKR